MQTKRLSIALAVVVAIVAILLIVPSFIDWSKYQSLAQTKIKEATGYDASIGSLRMSLLPAPHAVVKGVTLKKGTGEAFLTMDQANVRVALFPLIGGKVEVADISLDKPIVNLITYKDGTDNYMPVKAAAVTPAVDPVTGQPVVAKAADASTGQSIAIKGAHISDGVVTIKDEAKNTTQTVGIKDLHVKADTLSGPFNGDGDITYNNARFDVSLSTGGYQQGQSFPAQIDIQDHDNRAEFKYSGVIDIAQKGVQGETTLSVSDLPGLLKDIGVNAAIPSLGDKTQLSGMLTANAQNATLTNGTFVLSKTKFKTALNATLGAAKTIALTMAADDVLDVDAMTKIADSVKKSESKKDANADKAAPAAANSKAASTLVPLGFTIPADLTANVTLSAPGLKYKGEKTGAFQGRAAAAKGVGNVAITLDAIPGGGNINVVASTTTTPGELAGTISGALQNLKATLSKWLEVVDAKTFDQPGIPQGAALDGAFQVEGNAATLTIKSLSLGEPKINGMVSYTTGARPLVNAQLHATSFTLPAAKGEATASAAPAKADDKKADKASAPKLDFDINPPQLPFAVKFDVSADRLTRGDLVITAVRAIGDYDGVNAVNLTGLSGTVSGGTLTALGKIADLKNLSGVDMQAGLKTSDLDGFVAAMTGKPLALKQKIGAFEGAVKAKGDRKSMAVAASAQAWGYTVDASGTLDDPLSPELPGTLNVRVRHPDLAGAIRAFSPGFAGTPGKPVDIAGAVKISGKVYSVTGLKGQIGGSDITGDVKADLSGTVPDIKATIASNTLDVGALVGVKNKTAKTAGTATAASGAPASADGSAGQWSREAMDTSFLKSMKLDLNVTAGTLDYGTWSISNAKAGVNMKDGSLKVSPLSGGLYGGKFDGELNATSTGAGQPLNVAFKADADSVAVGPFLQALTSSATKRADGTASVSIDIKGAGASAAALVGSLAGGVNVKAIKPVIYGMDIDKLAANIVEAFDGGWKGVLTGGLSQSGFSGGQTAFKDIDQKFAMANGAMPISNFKLETVNGNAIVNTNGTVNFAAWTMNLQSNVQVTQPKDIPVIGVTLAGPLDAPQKNVTSQALDNLVQQKLGGQVQKLIGKKLGNDSPAGALINNLLGGGQSQNTAPAATTTPDASTTATTPAEQTQTQSQTKQNAQQQLLQGVLNSLSR